MDKVCFECGKTYYFNHHVIPVVLGGTKTIPLCIECHGKVHSIEMTSTKELTKAGLRKAAASGVILGRPKGRKDIKKRDNAGYLRRFESDKPLKLSKREENRLLRKKEIEEAMNELRSNKPN